MKNLAIILGAFALLLSACSGSGGAQVATLSGSPSTTVAGGTDGGSPTDGVWTDEERLLAFAACMRDNGVDGFEDPILNADGSVDFGFGPRSGDGADPFGGVDRDVVRAAFQACSGDLEGLAFGPGGGDFDPAEFQDTFVEFAACMRDHGVQMDDPDFSSFGPGQRGEGGGPFGDIDFDDPTVQDALDACQSIFGGILPGQGGGPGGGPGGFGGGPGGGPGGAAPGGGSDG